MRRAHSLAATTGAVSWTFYEADDFNVPRIDIDFDTAPTSAGLLTVSKDSVLGAAFDTVIRVINPVGETSVHFEGIYGLVNGDKIVVTYDNPDSREVTGSASIELLLQPWDQNGITVAEGLISSNTPKYASYRHLPLFSADPGASGPTFVPADANQLSGWRLDAATEILYFNSDFHSDWDQISDPVVEITFTVNIDNTLGNAADEVDFQLVATYAGEGEAIVKSQSISESTIVGACAQYTIFHEHFNINYNEVDNVLQAMDVISLRLRIEATSDVADIVVNDAAIFYSKYKIGTELSTV
jgi:hypothetical protein